MGAPAFAVFEQFLRRGQVLPAEGDGEAFAYAVIRGGQNIGPPEGEHQQHFHGPLSDSANGGERSMISSLVSLATAREPGTIPWTVLAAMSLMAAVLARERPAVRMRSSGVARMS